jgi:nitroimidazol reductase NimA-like FMN-containing flavoprotein (pyridoxamine 5'-phosphate oxidase superfamily)
MKPIPGKFSIHYSVRQRGDTMRRKDRLITNAETSSILEKGEYGILSTVSSNNEPYSVPLNYFLIDECIYFHCAIDGRKINNINNNPKVSFCVVGETEVLPDKFGTKYESCIVEGLASELFGEEKQWALEGLIHKYSGNFFSEGLKYIEKLKDKTRVFKISIESISGKARK